MQSLLVFFAFVGQASALALSTAARPMRAAARSAVSMKVGLVYSTTTGNTETVAGYLADLLGAEAKDIADCTPDELMGYDGLVCGAPTWHTGADTERSGTSWDEFLYGDLTSMALDGKPVAIFGLGDQAGYSDNFVDAMDELASCFKAQGAKIVGATSTDGYDHQESKSIAGGKFIGLACDEDNQPDLSEERCQAWVEQIKSEGMAV